MGPLYPNISSFFLILIANLFLLSSLFGQAVSSDNIYELLVKGHYSTLSHLVEKRIAEGEENAADYYYLGLSWRGLHQYDKSLNAFKKAAELIPGKTEYLEALARNHVQLGMYEEAIATYLSILNKEKNLAVLSDLGDLYIKMGQYRKGVIAFEKLVQAEPNNCYFLKNLGLCHLNIDSLEIATRHFKSALKQNSLDRTLIIHISNAYLKQNQADSAYQVVHRALIINPEDKKLLRAEAEILYKLKQYPEAINHYTRFYMEGDSSLKIMKKLGMCFYFTEEIPSALLVFRKVVETDTSDAIIYYYYGLAQMKINNYSRAAMLLERAKQNLLPVYTTSLYMDLGRCYDELKDSKKALNAFQTIHKLYPEHIAALYFLANLYDRYYEDPQVAINYYKKFIKLANFRHPYVGKATERIDKLEEKKFFKQ